MSWLVKILLPWLGKFLWKRVRPMVVKLLKWIMRNLPRAVSLVK